MKKRIGLAAVTLIFSMMAGSISYAAAGWSLNNGTWYYTEQNGSNTTGRMRSIDSQKYAFDGNGAMLHDVWWYENSEERWYYLSGSGAAVKGWLQLGSDWYYLLPSSGTMVSDGFRTIDGVSYYFNPNGSMRKNAYAGEKYLDENGIQDSRYDIKVRGKTDKETLETAGDNTVMIPGWLLDNIFKSGWKIACNAELADYGNFTHEDYDTFIRYYNLDTGRKLVFFIQPDYIVQGIGLYVHERFGKPGSGEDFQGAYSQDWNMVTGMFDQVPIMERAKDVAFAEVFALYYNEDEDVRKEFRELCPALSQYMDRFMEECRTKALTGIK